MVRIPQLVRLLFRLWRCLIITRLQSLRCHHPLWIRLGRRPPLLSRQKSDWHRIRWWILQSFFSNIRLRCGLSRRHPGLSPFSPWLTDSTTAP